jgi:hypothetical protein
VKAGLKGTSVVAGAERTWAKDVGTMVVPKKAIWTAQRTALKNIDFLIFLLLLRM